MKERKPIAPRLKKWLKENGKDALGESLDFIGENTKIPVLSNIIEGWGESMQDDPELTPEQKLQIAEAVKADLKELEQLTERWKSDNEQELKLPKLIRPLVLAFTWILLTTLVVLNACGVEIDSKYISTFEILALSVNGAYFSARTIEKYHAKKYK